MCIHFLKNITKYCINNNTENTGLITPDINNKFLITSYQDKWFISNKIFYISNNRSKIIYFCYNKNNKNMYLAKVSKYKQNEIYILNKLRNNNLCVEVKDIFNNQYGSIIIMRYYPNSDLKKFYITQNKYNLDIIIYNLILCIESIHKLKIYHRDIKLENFIIGKLPKFKVLLSDFEMSTSNLYLNNKQGSLYYLPPEYFTHKNINNKKRDLWALGIVIYYTIYKKFPFEGKTYNEIKKNIIYETVIYNIKYKRYNFIIYNLLQKNAEKRKIIKYIK